MDGMNIKQQTALDIQQSGAMAEAEKDNAAVMRKGGITAKLFTGRAKRFSIAALLLMIAAALISDVIMLAARAEYADPVDNVIYVSVNGGGATKDGKSWTTAYAAGSLQTAVDQSAASKDQNV